MINNDKYTFMTTDQEVAGSTPAGFTKAVRKDGFFNLGKRRKKLF